MDVSVSQILRKESGRRGSMRVSGYKNIVCHPWPPSEAERNVDGFRSERDGARRSKESTAGFICSPDKAPLWSDSSSSPRPARCLPCPPWPPLVLPRLVRLSKGWPRSPAGPRVSVPASPAGPPFLASTAACRLVLGSLCCCTSSPCRPGTRASWATAARLATGYSASRTSVRCCPPG